MKIGAQMNKAFNATTEDPGTIFVGRECLVYPSGHCNHQE
jgi:hypothetical protein